MQATAFQRVYRSIRYNAVLRPVLDIAACLSLRCVGLTLTTRPEGQLVVLGHMRSGSSLLSTLLTANPEINGYGEAKVTYRNQRDFLTLRGKIAVVQLINRRLPQRRCRYVFDKLLHQRLMPSPEPLAAANTRVILLTRPPEPTLRSIMGTFGWEADQSARYLLREYEHIESLIRRMPASVEMVRVDHEDLIGQPDALLDAVTRWLGLSTPLRSEFDPKARVKLVGSNDRSERIDAGKILKGPSKHEVDISAAPLDELESKFAALRSTIEEHAQGWDRCGPTPG
ncbi:MAG: hypothetical protein ACF8LL_13815 [Phycisphaerales bacterium]